MKNFRRFIARAAMMLLLVNLAGSFAPGFLADNLAPKAYAVQGCEVVPDKPTCNGIQACSWNDGAGACYTKYRIINTLPVDQGNYNGSDTISVIFDDAYNIDESNGVWDAQAGGDTFLCPGAATNLGECQGSEIAINVAKYDDNANGTFNGLHIDPQSTPLTPGPYKVFLQDICRDNGGAGTYMAGGAQFIPEYCIPNNYHFSFTVGEPPPVLPAFIFITSTIGDGSIGSIANADSACQTRAGAAGLDGTWHAIISGPGDPNINAADGLAAVAENTPFFLLNGIQVANNKADLLDGSIQNPIFITEFGTPYSNIQGHPGLAWTASDSAGLLAAMEPYANLSCNGWTSSSSDGRAIAGIASKTDADWIDGIPENDGAMHCDQNAALYCWSDNSAGLGGREICDNQIDDNGNDLVDCADKQCQDMPMCGGGGGGMCDMDNTLDGTNPFEGGEGEICDGSAFWPGHESCEDFGYDGGTFSCNLCKFDFRKCYPQRIQGAGEITVNLMDNSWGGPFDWDGEGEGTGVLHDTSVVVQCGDLGVEINPPEPGPPAGEAEPPVGESTFYGGGVITAGTSSVTIRGLPTPMNSTDDPNPFDNPCLVFLAPSPDITMGNDFGYMGGLNSHPPMPYLKNTDGTLPMPPMGKYAAVWLGDPDSNQIDLRMTAEPLAPGDLYGYVCLDYGNDGECNEGDLLLNDMQVNILPMGQMPPGFQMPEPVMSGREGWDPGYYEFGSLPGGDYMVQAMGQYMGFSMVTVSGETQQNIAIPVGTPLDLKLDTNSDECWDQEAAPVNYSFWPVNWNFNSRPVFGHTDRFGDNVEGIYTIPLTGFGPEEYNYTIDIPGCVSMNGTIQMPERELPLVLDGGNTLTGVVQDEAGDPISGFNFGAQTVWDPEHPMAFGGYAGAKTDGDGLFTLTGITEGHWQFTSFGGSSDSRSFAGGPPSSLDADGVYNVTGDADIVLVVRNDRRVNITVTDGINKVTDAMIDIHCDTGKYVHIGLSNDAWTYLPPGDTCLFTVQSRSGNYKPLINHSVAIAAGDQPLDVTLPLNSYNTNLGVYAGSTFKSDKTTTYPGGTINYKGHIVSMNVDDLTNHTVTFAYPSGIPDENLTATTSTGTECSASSGTLTCPTGTPANSFPAESFFDVFVALDVPTGYSDPSLSAALNIASTPVNIGNVFAEIVQLSISAPNVVANGENFTVYGQAYPNATVTLSYLDADGAETTVGSTVMDPNSTWYTFSGVNIVVDGDYTLKTTAVGEGATASVTRNITVGGDTPKKTSITMTVNGFVWENNDSTGIPAGLILAGTPFTVDLTFNVTVGHITSVTGVFAGGSYDFTDMDGGAWHLDVSSGWEGFGDLPFDVTVTWDNDDDGDTPDVVVPYDTLVKGNGGIDPSGYVYDTDPANRISGVTATVYQLVAGASHATLGQGTTITSFDGVDDGTGAGIAGNGIIENDEEGAVSGFGVGKITGCGALGVLDTTLCTWTQWNAAPTGQINPQTTDLEGRYAWNVPVGWYRVAFQKSNPGGYSLSYSRDVYVPPAETGLNVNVGAYDIGAPTVTTNPADTDTGVARNVKPTVVFSEPMQAGTITTANIKLLDADNADADVSITVTYNPANHTAILEPTAPPLVATNDYKIRVTTGVTDDTSNALATEVNNTFQTAAGTDVNPPTSTADQATGNFSGSIDVNLSATDEAAPCSTCVIYYTTNGIDPTASSPVYTDTLTFTATTTLKFLAKDAVGNTEGAANTRTYTLITTPTAPTGLVETPVASAAGLNWDDTTSATSYKVYRSLTSGAGYAEITAPATRPATSNYTDYTAAVGTTYYYKVAATNAVGDSSLSGYIAVIPVAATQQQIISTGPGGSNDGNQGKTLSKISSLVTGDQTFSRTLELSASMITTTASGEKSAQLTGANGSITLLPAKNSDLSAVISASTTVTAPADWNGKIQPPTVQSVVMLSNRGETIEGTTEKLDRNETAAIIKIGATNNVPLNFSNPVTLEIPVDLPDGTVVTVLFSQDGNNWESMATGTVVGGKVTFTATHFSYFALAQLGQVVALGKTGGFGDIMNHWARTYIERIYGLGIVSGKSATRFAPDDPITRAELTKIAVKAFALTLPEGVTEKPFGDVDAKAWYAPYVKAAKDAGIAGGYANGTFHPNAPVTRSEALKMLLSATGFNDIDQNFETNYASHSEFIYAFFHDVPMTQWFAKYVAYAKDKGIVNGKTATSFAPADSITRAEVAKIVTKLLDLK